MPGCKPGLLSPWCCCEQPARIWRRPSVSIGPPSSNGDGRDDSRRSSWRSLFICQRQRRNSASVLICVIQPKRGSRPWAGMQLTMSRQGASSAYNAAPCSPMLTVPRRCRSWARPSATRSIARRRVWRSRRAHLLPSERPLHLPPAADRSDRAARALLALGVEHGDRVGIWSPNAAEWVITQYAAAKVGAILVNINPAYRLRELEYALNQSGVSVLVTAREFRTTDYVAMLAALMPELDDGAAGRSPPRDCRRCGTWSISAADGTPGGIGWTEFARARRARGRRRACARARRSLQFDDPVNIQYTSGTTGSPKGATLSHHNILNNGFFVGEALRYTADDRICVPVPFYHCFGCVMGNLAAADARRGGRHAGRSVRCRGDAARHRRGTVHVDLRRADDVHRDARSSGVRQRSDSTRCGPASWPARRARSKSCARSSTACTCPK